jgi:hypothetical protein
MHAPASPTTTVIRPTTLLLIVATTAYAVAYRFIPYDVQMYFLWPLGALGLFTGARLRLLPALVIGLGVQLSTDLIFYVTKQWPTGYAISSVLLVYSCLLVNVVLGRYLLWQTSSAVRVVGGGLLSFVYFFLATNFGAWLETARVEYSPHTFSTLMMAYREGLEFVKASPGQIIGTPLCALILFGADIALARATATKTETEKVR